MTEKELKSYKSLQRQAERLRDKIAAEQDREIAEVNGKVTGSSAEFPYIEQRYSVPMFEPVEYTKSCNKIREWKERLKDKECKIKVIEDFIDGIPDEETKEIFTYFFIDSMTQKEIAKLMNRAQSGISQKIKDILNV